MDGFAKYELLQRVAGVKIVVFRGRETRGGQSVLLHQLIEPNDHTAVLKRALQYLLIKPASAGGRIQDLVEIQGGYFIVTLDQPECLALHEWLDWELGPKAAPSSTPSPLPAAAPPAETREPGEFTQLFQKAPSSTVRPEERPAAQTGGPGEFTQLFERPGQSQRADPVQPLRPSVGPSVGPVAPSMPPSMPMAPAPLAAENQPGEFTRLVSEPAHPTVRSVQGAAAGRVTVAKHAGRVHADLRRRNAQRKQPALRDAHPRTARGATFFARLPDRKPGAATRRAETERASNAA